MNHKKLSTILAFAIFLLSSLAEAQEAAPQANEQAPRVFDFHFEGGNAFQLQTAIQERELNFIVPEEADEVHIPKFSVRNVQPKELFNALDLLLGTSNPRYLIQIESTHDNEIWVLKMYTIPTSPPRNEAIKEEPTNRVSDEISRRRAERHAQANAHDPHKLVAAPNQSPPQQILNQSAETGLFPYINRAPLPLQDPGKVVTRPINIGKQLETTSIEGISSLIRSTIEAGHEPDSKPKIDIKFHKETKVLILSGTRDTIALAITAIKQISTKDHAADE